MENFFLVEVSLVDFKIYLGTNYLILPTDKSLFNVFKLCVGNVILGSYMYSGGGEGVMVRWNMEVSNMRNFLPRLPAPILHLTVSPDNQSVAISTQDNGEDTWVNHFDICGK